MFHSKLMETLVGLFIVLGLSALVVLALKVSNLSITSLSKEKTYYSIKAEFDNIGGLKVRAPVKLAGVLVGRVAAITVDQGNYVAVVRMMIDSQYKLPEDTSASIFTAGLLGEQYISLEPGGAAEMLKAGGEITLTQSAVVLEQVIGQFLYDKAAEGGKNGS